MGKIAAFILVFLVVCVGLMALASKDPTTGGGGANLFAFLAPNPNSLEAQARQSYAQGDTYAAQAQAAREQAAQATQYAAEDRARQTQAAADEYAARTATVQAATAEAQATATQQIMQVTLEAAKAQATQQAQITATALYWNNVNMQATASADDIKKTAMAVQAEQIQQAAQRNQQIEDAKTQAAKAFAWFWANWPLWILVIVCAFAAGGGAAVFLYFTKYKWTLVPTDGNNHFGVAQGNTLTNMDQMVQQSINTRLPVPVTSVDQQNHIATLHQGGLGIQWMGKKGYSKDSYAAAQQLSQAVNGQQQALPQVEDQVDPTAPAKWDLFGWTGKTLPLGVGLDKSGIELDPQKTPNLVIASTSNGGKTMQALRPIAAEALVSGWQVLTANIKGGDFAPLNAHPNLVHIKGEAPEVADLLEALLGEVRRRNNLLESYGISTYYRLGNAEQVVGPKIMVMIDEIVSLIYGAPDNATVSQIWRTSVNIASKCRAMGVMLVLAGTDITYRLGKDWLALRANCGRMAFHMMDRDMSRALLDIGGAESLKGPQFIARLDGDPVRGVAFHPEDDQIKAFLAARPVKALPAPAWLHSTPPLKPDPQDIVDPEIVRLAEKIRPVWEAAGSKSRMAIEAGFSQYGGGHVIKINQAIDYLVKKYGSTTSTTSTTTTVDSENGPIAL